MPDTKSHLRKVLYASFRTDESLPGYVRYALEGLVQTGFEVVYLTNERDLDADAHAFLDSHHIELFFTVNRGFDFGMWRRYIQYTAKFRREEWERLVLVNDSVVYFQNRFRTVFDKAETSAADMVSLTENSEFSQHLQSFFLYLKPKAISFFCERILKEPEAVDYQDAVRRLEVGTSVAMREASIGLEALYHTQKLVVFDYPELIRNQCGFVKRRLLERRWTCAEACHFWFHGEGKALMTDYVKFIAREGSPDKDFDLKWLRIGNDGLFERTKNSLKFACYRFRYVLSKLRGFARRR